MVVQTHLQRRHVVFLASGAQTLDDRLCGCRGRKADRDGWGAVLEVDKMVVEAEIEESE